MQEHEHVAARFRSAGIHLQRPSARRREHVIGPQPRALHGRVLAAAVDDDDFDAKPAQLGERIERAGNAFAFVEHRHDDGEAGHGTLSMITKRDRLGKSA